MVLNKNVVESNDKGQLLMRVDDALLDAYNSMYGNDWFGLSRYNGGWCKHITGLNKSKTDGYSLLGDFIKSEELTWITAGVYLDCSIEGSRKNHVKYYHLILIKTDGSAVALAKESKYSGSDWAVKYWKIIEEVIANPAMLEPEQPSQLQELKAQEAALVEQLDKVRTQIQELQNEEEIISV